MAASSRPIALRIVGLTLALLAIPAVTLAQTISLPGLRDTVTVNTPETGIPTIDASNEFDMYFMQGYIHARDRFWQMDTQRRLASGTLAELVGTAALPNDIQLRTLGLRRAAWETYATLSSEVRAALRAYSHGVNTWLAQGNLPVEYGALELTQAESWSPVDSVSVGTLIAFSLDFDNLADIDRTINLLTYQAVGDIVGFDGTALFFEDTHRLQPPDGRVTVPDFLASIGGLGKATEYKSAGSMDTSYLTESHLNLARNWADGFIKDPFARKVLDLGNDFKGSNWWMLSGALSDTGAALLANDPHLTLDTPAIWYPIHLIARDDSGTIFNVTGASFAGAPGLIHGCNESLCWGSTVNPIDAFDIYTEQLAFNAIGLPSHTIHDGQPEAIITVFQTYFANQLDGQPDNMFRLPTDLLAGGATLLVPRRNNGPLVDLDLDAGTAISAQYTGFGASMNFEAFFGFANATSVEEFGAATELFDTGSQNWAVVDTAGSIGYFAAAEVPIREDFQNLMGPDGGVPPIFIRDGSGTLMHDWAPVTNPQPNQALGYEILTKNEMPHSVNPDQGFLVNANNDPIGVTLDNNPFNQVRPGGGLYYLSPGYVSYRMGRIDRLMNDAVAAGPVSADQFKAFQANNQMLDAELVMPHVMGAWLNAADTGAWPGIAQFLLDPQMQQVFGLWSGWDFSTPTGIAEGYDPGENPFALSPPSQAEIDASVAATVWNMWRGQVLANTIDGVLNTLQLGGNLPPNRNAYNSLKNLLDNFDSNQGFGASGLPFFNVPDAPDAESARDFILLFSVRQALDLLASDEFAPAFANSTDIMDYRWGKLHRIEFDHLLNDVFTIPNGLYGFSTVPGLTGISRSGGYEVLDASSFSSRADGLNDFMFGAGPSRRFVGQMFPAPIGVVPEMIIGGGQSGVLGTVEYANQLYFWLVNAYFPLFLDADLVSAIALGSETYGPN